MHPDSKMEKQLVLGSFLQWRTIPSEGLTESLQPPTFSRGRKVGSVLRGQGVWAVDHSALTEATATVCVIGNGAWPRILAVKVGRSAEFLNCFEHRVKIMF